MTSPPMSDVKRRLLARLAAGSAGPPPPRVPRRTGTGPVPLSYAQARVWLMDRLAGELPLFNLVIAGRLPMDVDREELTRRLAVIVGRHDAMRMSVTEDAGEPFLHVAEQVPVDIPLVDLSGVAAAQAEEMAFRHAYETGSRPYRLDRAPLWRVELVRLGPADHVLVIAAHHIAVDGTSLTLILRELAGFDEPELPVGYADFAAWQRGPAVAEQDRGLAYWTERLAGLDPLDLPADRRRPARPTYQGDSLQVVLDPSLVGSLAGIGRAAGATPYMTVLAAFCVLLHRYTGVGDVSLGAFVSGRTEPELHNLVGMFSNMIVVRADLGGGPGFRQVIERVKSALLGAMAHQDVPFERLVRELGHRSGGDRSAPPLVRVAYNMPAEAGALPPIGSSLPLDFTHRGSQLDLTLHMIEEAGTIRLTFEYATDLFDAATVDRMSGHFCTLLAGLAADPDAPVARVAMTGPAEDRRLAAYEQGAPYDRESPAADSREFMALHELVAEQARRTPDAVAVAGAGRPRTYAELEADSDAVAHRLREAGVGPESPVGVFLRRGAALPAALLAVWKTGGAYVPLDPGHPRDRLATVAADCGVRVVVTTPDLAGRLPDGLTPVFADEVVLPGVFVPAPADPDRAAYVMYTSGSTGRPKGVVISHAGIANRVLWTVAEHGLHAGDRVLQKTPLTFDAAGWEFFAPLVSGGTVVLAPEGAERDPGAIVTAVGDHDVTVLQVVPALLRLLVEEPGWERNRALRLLFCAGEPLHADLCARLRALSPARIVNTYGPTECSIDVTAHEVGQETGPIPIGRPIGGLRIRVLADGERVPEGVVGELMAGGAGVARGYLGRPALTAERFVPDPHGPPGSRLYRTGDLARWTGAGVLEFLGRTDDQIKINGVRVEPAEIEAALAACPQVSAAVVTPRRAPSGGVQLVAHVTARSGSLVVDALREAVRGRLPEAMVPAAIVELPSFPRTSSGKIDRLAVAALPVTVEDGPRTPPRTATEKTVAEVWTTLLNLEPGAIALEDDFFRLGGHSLLLARLAARLAETTGRAVPLPELFTRTTVRDQAAYLDGPARQAPPPLVPVPRTGRLPLSFGQRRLWFLDRLRPGSAEYVVPLVVPAPGGWEATRERLLDVARAHDVLRTRYAAGAGDPYAVVDEEPAVLLEEASADSAAGVTALLAAELARGFDLERGPVWRALLVHVPGGADLLLVTVHHIACDARSVEVLTRALGGDGIVSPRLGYPDFAEWQRRTLTGAYRDRLVAHWKERLTGVTPLDLPADRPRPPIRDARGAMHAFSVPALGLLDRGRRAGATAFMTVLAAFTVFLARHTGRTDLPVGVPVDGRDRPELDDVLGFFVNTLVLRADLSGAPDFDELLTRIRTTALDAFAHRDLPFEVLVDELRPERDMSRIPITDVLFDLQTGDRPEDLSEDGEGLSAWRTAKADLTLMVRLSRDGTLTCRFEYATALFDPATIEHFADRFSCLITALATATGPAENADLLSPGERATLTDYESGTLHGPIAARPAETGSPESTPGTLRDRIAAEPNDSRRPELAPGTLHGLVAAHTAATPGALAVTAPGTPGLTYQELSDRAARLAARLRAAGTRRGDVVGVCLERGPDLVVALLAVLRAGAAYLPLDPDDPRERLAWLVADTDAAAVVTEFPDRLPSVVPLLSPADESVRETSRDAAPEPAGPGDLAYVIYTSGSTGTPKGVMIEHAGIVNRIRWMQRAYGLRPGDRVLQKTPATFDVSVWEFFWPLITGATLVTAPPGAHRDPRALAGVIAGEDVTHLHFVPSMLEAFLAVVPTVPQCVREVFASGEALTASAARAFHAAAPHARLHNLYGPTELSVDVTAIEVPAGQTDPVPIGAPIDGMRVVVVDGQGRRAPVGVPGHLLAGGVGTARGYVNRPGLTATRFTPDPDRPGERLYHTGDLARWTRDGVLEFLGRADDQVKLRGVRIEPGEIAAVAATLPGVREAVVTVAGDRLVGYYVATGEPPHDRDIVTHCARRLPAALVPAVWTRLDALPVGRNGKLDRAALPAPGPAAVEGDRPPEGVAEERVAAVWAELLGVEPGAHQDFYALGGHSLLAVRVQHRLAEEFDVDLPLRALFESTTVATLAAAVETALSAQIDDLSDAEIERLLAEDDVPADGARHDA
ncbi:non-ribosomal peptide synthetase [Herbidospora mongoliensis]|uniref:non-ribosomal peptide synthetase n=1 Tax=Herbidospora mongoliensis TaxID=688067 RepID=UPI0009FEFAD2|nr:non-ribosomal peptide synthetase [Herbidospora mongoliensis]